MEFINNNENIFVHRNKFLLIHIRQNCEYIVNFSKLWNKIKWWGSSPVRITHEEV
jgi:hypothetical protein